MTTPQPIDSKRRVLMLFDEFSSLGHFNPVADKIKIAAGSYIKIWLILQNIGQILEVYKNHADFTGSCEQNFFGIKSTDSLTIEYIHNALGKYTETINGEQKSYDLLTKSELSEFLDSGGHGQIVIPSTGNPLMLRRIVFKKNYIKSQYGTLNF